MQWFEGVIDGSNKLVQLKHTKSSNSFRFNQTTIYATNHYMILKLKDSNNKVIKTKIYNHLGIDLSNKLTLKDPATATVAEPRSLSSSFFIRQLQMRLLVVALTYSEMKYLLPHLHIKLHQ